MARQVFPTLYDAPDASPFAQQVFRPRPVADAQNRLVQLQINPPAFPQQPYPAAEQAGPTVARASFADTPLPPPRPSSLGQTLSKAVVRPDMSAPRRPAQTQQQAQAPADNGMFTTVQFNPNQRNAPIYTALNLGGLFGGGGGEPSAPAPAAAPAQGRTALRAPPGGDWTVDENGNPVPNYPSFNLSTDELSAATSKPGWYRNLR